MYVLHRLDSGPLMLCKYPTESIAKRCSKEHWTLRIELRREIVSKWTTEFHTAPSTNQQCAPQRIKSQPISTRVTSSIKLNIYHPRNTHGLLYTKLNDSNGRKIIASISPNLKEEQPLFIQNTQNALAIIRFLLESTPEKKCHIASKRKKKKLKTKKQTILNLNIKCKLFNSIDSRDLFFCFHSIVIKSQLSQATKHSTVNTGDERRIAATHMNTEPIKSNCQFTIV